MVTAIPAVLICIISPPIDLAEYVLNKCITQEQEISNNGEDTIDGPIITADRPVHYNFDILEDKDHRNHILLWMVGNQSESV